ncbi:MAG: hypothetical protein JSV88_30400 [Candidatus Aminicenantes bacterium]|nr:MAG: hypothetical protein JSV88_30400 [Candidatus Aminicenantes bacterium]
MSIEEIIGLILYIAPGFLTMEVYHAFYPVRERNNFILSTWSIIYGVTISAFVRGIDTALLNNILQSNKNTFPSFPFIMVLFFVGILVGLFLVLINRIRFGISQKWPQIKGMAPDPRSTWAKINQPANEDWATVFLDDGAIYLGWIKYYTFDPNADNQDFLLSHAKRVDENLNIKYEIDGLGVYINTKDVKRIEFLKGETISIQ